ncbi:alkaline phosphatase D family protein [Lysobacter sp. SG-8]|uniref:Alkaline phosphatase D family protein n=1 Tax=Marilutibacter penaei TaxID=2759900 RepID=A0A7W3YFI1_9GAMM|nr:alkaline phosphatase D family protein [Lysobacter penaei]MBB1089523.1 alkaline phosphatase D family protein [Lysobacter penaei]
MTSSVSFDRRRFLLGAGSLALFAGLSPFHRVVANPRLGGYPFTLGVASGDPLPGGFVLWTRLAPKPLEEHGGMPMVAVPVRWELAADDGFRRVLRRGETLALPELGHSVHVELDGLAPGRPYWYRFHVEGADASPVGVVRTAPAPDALPERVRIAVAGCQAYYHGWFEAYRHLSEEDGLDAVFHYGDYIYEGPAGRKKDQFPTYDAAGRLVAERDHVGDEIYSLDDYRRRYALYKSDPDLQAAHAAAAFVMSFDDHEIDNDWNNARDQDGRAPEVFALRKFVAMQAWYENLPVRRALLPRVDGGTRYYRRLDFGRLLRMHVLDTRSHRLNQACEPPASPGCRFQPGQPSSILGDAQEAWLDQGLDNDAGWNLIAQQVFVMPLKAKNADGTLREFDDKWDGFPQSRQRLVHSIRERGLTNVVVATGDAHMNAIGDIPLSDEAPEGPAVAAEFLATSISSNGDGAVDSPNATRFLHGENPFLQSCDNLRGYHLHDITAKEWRTDVRAMDQVQRKGGRIRTHERFFVTPDRAGLQRG